MSVKLFISSLPSDTNQDELYDVLSKYAFISSIKLVRDKKLGFCLGYGNIFVPDENSCYQLLGAQIEFKNRGIVIDPFLSGNQLEMKQNNLYSRRVFLKHIPRKVTERELELVFGQFGPVEKAHYLHKDSKTSSSCGIVTFCEIKSAKRCLAEAFVKIPGTKKSIPCFEYNPKLTCKDNLRKKGYNMLKKHQKKDIYKGRSSKNYDHSASTNYIKNNESKAQSDRVYHNTFEPKALERRMKNFNKKRYKKNKPMIINVDNEYSQTFPARHLDYNYENSNKKFIDYNELENYHADRRYKMLEQIEISNILPTSSFFNSQNFFMNHYFWNIKFNMGCIKRYTRKTMKRYNAFRITKRG